MTREYWIHVVAIIVGLVMTPLALQSAYAARGYFAVGGEWLVLPLCLVGATLLNGIINKKEGLR